LEKPLTILTSNFIRSFTRSSLNRLTRPSSDLPSIVIKNNSGLSIPGLIVLWPDRRKSDNSLVNRGLGNKGINKLYIVLIVKSRPVEGKTLDNWESSTFDTKLYKNRPEDNPSNTGIFRNEALDSKLANQ